MSKAKPTKDRKPRPAPPGWVEGGEFLMDLAVARGMTRAEAKREVDRVFADAKDRGAKR